MKFATVADRLRYGKKLVSEDGAWVQHPGSHEHGTCCMVTSLGARLNYEWSQTEQAWDYLRRGIAAVDPSAVKNGDLNSVNTGMWNDSPGRTLDQVLAAFDAAIELAEKDGMEPA